MREFLSYVLESFRDATGWSRDNGYSDLNIAANELLNFPTPRGLRLSLSSLATPHFATGYTLGSVGVVDGAISYLYSSVPLGNVVAQSSRVPLPTLLRSYRQRPRPSGLPPVLDPAFVTPPRERVTLEGLFPFLVMPVHTHVLATTTASTPTTTITATTDSTSTTATTATPLPASPPAATVLASTLVVPVADQFAAAVHEARALVDKPALLYGRLYLPRSMLEAYMVKRLAPSVQLQLRAVSDAKLPNGGTVLGVMQLDRGRYGLEGLVSSDGGLLGVRGLYNFGHGGKQQQETAMSLAGGGGGGGGGDVDDRLNGRFSAGGEIYYGTLNKSGGVSLGARFETAAMAGVPEKNEKNGVTGVAGTPLTATLTINPLMGNLSAAYAVVAREDCSLATRFDFNVYSYESEWSVGMELWSTRRLAGLVAVDDAAATSPSSLTAPRTSTFGIPERSFQAKMEWRLDDTVLSTPAASLPSPETSPEGSPPPPPPPLPLPRSSEEKYQGVLKARLNQNLQIGLLWEGRIQSLLFSLGSAIDLHRLDQPFRTLGLEIQFSS
ncbi:mitochondrial protein [Sporothrix schenckii 1099-18]|uniref:Mitochondrial distribution and morphology protein 10 n=1 Tax=Sporothrix schenckii 1099-18 TaxID=1397361 RepID=A0A0F2MKG2_SPOSC|nr:mitochondrial protein [Sporothrix schenckii 1099-18]KJR89325.1 mitochondrial protein [Sporothrix schenckii 1099-18]